MLYKSLKDKKLKITPTCFGSYVIHHQGVQSCAWLKLLWCVCTVRPAGNYSSTTSSQPAVPYTHTPQVQNYAAKHWPSTRQNICEPLWVISIKHSPVLPDDGSHKIRNMSEWFLIFYLLNFYTTQILTSKFCKLEFISWIINVNDVFLLGPPEINILWTYFVTNRH